MAERRMSYAEQLKDPRWQKKRLEILERDDFECQRCWSKEKTLHVHHTYYERGLSVWEHDPKYLLTLCEDCHKDEQELMDAVYRALGRHSCLLEQVRGYIWGILASRYMVSLPLDSFDFCLGLADGAGVPSGVVTAAKDMGLEEIDGNTLKRAWLRYRRHEYPWVDDEGFQFYRKMAESGDPLPEIGIRFPEPSPPVALSDAFLPHLGC